MVKEEEDDLKLKFNPFDPELVWYIGFQKHHPKRPACETTFTKNYHLMGCRYFEIRKSQTETNEFILRLNKLYSETEIFKDK